LRLGLAAQLKRPRLDLAIKAIGDAVRQLEIEIDNLRSLIADLRPATLDDLGAEQAIKDLAGRARDGGLAVELTIDLADEHGRQADQHAGELETAMYRIVQEALTNAIRHGNARHIGIAIEDDHDTIGLTVRDDGDGFVPAAETDGYGLLRMEERAPSSSAERSRSSPRRRRAQR
jgi:signal transduction histidine kinase